MVKQDTRWFFPDINQAIIHSKKRNQQGIHVTLAPLSEYARKKEQTTRAVESAIAALDAIHAHALDASLSLKLTALGILFDENAFHENFFLIHERAIEYHLGLEVDMEGKGIVEPVLKFVGQVADRVSPFTVAIQAYLNRSGDDIQTLVNERVRVRLVKGAYLGDVRNFIEIQDRFKALFRILLASGQPFSVGTHDPELIGWIKEQLRNSRSRIEMGFLMGLDGETIVSLASWGWNATEYVPFGEYDDAYRARRIRYLSSLVKMGRSTVP